MRKNSAITFIELLVVIIIIGILAAVAVPAFKKTFDNLALDNFSKDIYYLCLYLQSSAVSQGKTYSLNIAPAEGKFQAGYKNEKDEFVREQGRLGRAYTAPREVTVLTSAGSATIYFYPDGSTSEAGVTFENDHGHKVSLSVKGASGGIKIQ